MNILQLSSEAMSGSGLSRNRRVLAGAVVSLAAGRAKVVPVARSMVVKR